MPAGFCDPLPHGRAEAQGDRGERLAVEDAPGVTQHLQSGKIRRDGVFLPGQLRRVNALEFVGAKGVDIAAVPDSVSGEADSGGLQEIGSEIGLEGLPTCGHVGETQHPPVDVALHHGAEYLIVAPVIGTLRQVLCRLVDFLPHPSLSGERRREFEQRRFRRFIALVVLFHEEPRRQVERHRLLRRELETT